MKTKVPLIKNKEFVFLFFQTKFSSIYISIYLYIYISIYLYTYISIYIYLYICIYIYGSFPNLGVPYFGVLIVRILLFRVLYQGTRFGSPIFGNSKNVKSILQFGNPCETPKPETLKKRSFCVSGCRVSSGAFKGGSRRDGTGLIEVGQKSLTLRRCSLLLAFWQDIVSEQQQEYHLEPYLVQLLDSQLAYLTVQLKCQSLLQGFQDFLRVLQRLFYISINI